MTQPKPRFYLPNLDTLRAIAALMVVVCHIELRKPDYVHKFQCLLIWGGAGVHIFFTLSGFLITYLLLREKEVTSTINIKDFYLRRVLRIWPLYFFVLLFTYLVIQYLMPGVYNFNARHTDWAGITMNVFFLTNVTLVMQYTPLVISTVWSIGIEEQFYLFWPWIARKAKAVALKLMLSIVIAIPLLRIAVHLLASRYHSTSLELAADIIATSRFDVMAMGGLLAYIGYYGSIRIGKLAINKQLVQHKAVQILAYLGFAFFLGMAMAGRFAEADLYGISFCTAIIIFNLSLNPASLLRIENKAGNYLGKISYGLYLLHMPLIYILYHYLDGFFRQLPVAIQQPVIYCIIVAATILVAGISYRFLETPFLKMKAKLAHIKTQAS